MYIVSRMYGMKQPPVQPAYRARIPRGRRRTRGSRRTTPTLQKLASSAGLLADRLPDFFHGQRSDVQEREDAAGAGFAALELPGERADDAAGVEDPLDVAAHVLGVDATFGEGQVVHREDLFLHQAAALVVAVLVLAEELQD